MRAKEISDPLLARVVGRAAGHGPEVHELRATASGPDDGIGFQATRNDASLVKRLQRLGETDRKVEKLRSGDGPDGSAQYIAGISLVLALG